MPSHSPQWAPHVVGEFPERTVDPETGESEGQLIKMRCSICKATYQYRCMTGAVRQHIQNFAVAHAHRDPLKEPIPGA